MSDVKIPYMVKINLGDEVGFSLAGTPIFAGELKWRARASSRREAFESVIQVLSTINAEVDENFGATEEDIEVVNGFVKAAMAELQSKMELNGAWFVNAGFERSYKVNGEPQFLFIEIKDRRQSRYYQPQQ